MFDHEKECSSAFRKAEGKKSRVGRFHEDLFALMDEWPEVQRLGDRVDRLENYYAEIFKGLIEASGRIESLEKDRATDEHMLKAENALRDELVKAVKGLNERLTVLEKIHGKERGIQAILLPKLRLSGW